MTMLRFLVLSLAALVVSASIGAAGAGPCSQQIPQVQAQIDAKLAADAAAGPSAREGLTALDSRQPTPQSIAEAESRVGDISHQLMATIGTGMMRARQAAAAGDEKACEDALAEVRRALGQ